MNYRGRFAPSPTGPLHFGSLLTAVASFADARHQDGRWLVRIDDLDQVRCIDGMDSRILHTLEAFGMAWDEAPSYQSRHIQSYTEALEQLQARHRVYACNCSRREVREMATNGPDGPVYPGRCRNRRLEDAPGRALRVITDGDPVAFVDRASGRIEQHLRRDLGDFVIRRADGFFAYQLAVVVDDRLTGITDVVRGRDLLTSTPRQLYLQTLLGLPHPRYLHVPLVLGPDGRKLSKSLASQPVDPDCPLPGLLSAWRHLGQHPPRGSDAPGGVEEFWEWAVRHWQPERMRQIREIQA